jgi:hypothetical protein
MPAFTTTIRSAAMARELPALVVEPESHQASAPILLFLHGRGEAGSSLNELPMVCVHQTPPFRAGLGVFPEFWSLRRRHPFCQTVITGTGANT